MAFNTVLDMERLEEQMYFHCPHLRAYNESRKESVRSKLFSQLHESLPSVSLQKYQVHMLLVNIEKNLQKCKDLGIIETTDETYHDMQQQHHTMNIKVPELSDLSDDEDVIKPSSLALKRSLFSEDDTVHSDYEDEIPLARRVGRKRQHDCLSDATSKTAKSRYFYRRESERCLEVMKSRGDSVKVSRNDSVDSSLSLTIWLPSFLRDTEKALEVSIDLGRIDLSRHVFDGKKRLISDNDECRNSSRISIPGNKNYIGSRVQKNSEKTYCISSDNEGTVPDDETLSGLISEVLMEPNTFDTWRTINLKNNNGDATNTQPNTAAKRKKLKCSEVENQDDFINKKKSRNQNRKIKDISKLPNSIPKKRGRKPNQQQNKGQYEKKKSEIAKYVELFGSNCDSPCTATTTTPVTMSQMVTSTTQNYEQPEQVTPQAAQITYLLNGEWVNGGYCEVIASGNVGNLNLDTCNVTQEDFTLNTPFEDFVNYIDSSNNDVGNNVIARVLDGSNVAIANTTSSVLNVDNIMTLGKQDNITDQFIKLSNGKITNSVLQNHNRYPPTIKMNNVISVITDLQTSSIPSKTNRQDNQIFCTNEGVLDLSRKSDDFNSTIIADDNETVDNSNCAPIDLSMKVKKSQIQQQDCTDNLQLTQGDDESDEIFLRRLIENSGFEYKTCETDHCCESCKCTDLLLETVLNENESFKAALDMPLLDNEESPLVIKSSIISKCDDQETFLDDCSTSLECKTRIMDISQNKVDAGLSILPPLTFIHTAEGTFDIFHSKKSNNQSNSQLQKSINIYGNGCGDENNRINNIDYLEIPSTMSLILKPENITNIEKYSSQETLNTNKINNNIESLKVADEMHSDDADSISENKEPIMNYIDNWKQVTSVESEKCTPIRSVYESLIRAENQNHTFETAKIIETIKKNEVLNNKTVFLGENDTKHNIDEKYIETCTKSNESNRQDDLNLTNKKNEHNPVRKCNKRSAINLHASKIDYKLIGGSGDITNFNEKVNNHDNISNTYNNESNEYKQTSKSKQTTLYISKQIVARVKDIEHNHENNFDYKLENQFTLKNKNIVKEPSNMQIVVSGGRSVDTFKNEQQTIKQNEQSQCGEDYKYVDKNKTNFGLIKSLTADIGVKLEITKVNVTVGNATPNGCRSKLDYGNKGKASLTNTDVSVEKKLKNGDTQPDKALNIINEMNNDHNDKKKFEKETVTILADVNTPKESKNINLASISHDSGRNIKSGHLIASSHNLKTAKADANNQAENVDLISSSINKNYTETLGKLVGIENHEIKDERNHESKNIARKIVSDLKKDSLETQEKRKGDNITDPIPISNIANKDPAIVSDLSLLELERTYDSCLDFEYQLDDDVLSLSTSCFNSPDDDRYCCSKLCEESEHTKQMVETNFLNNNSEDDSLTIKPLENISPRTEEQFTEKIKLSVDPKFETRLTKFKIPKIAAAINQPPAEVNGSPTKTNIGLSKITRTVQNICAVPPLQPAAVSSPCDLMTDRGQIAGQGGEAINRGAAMIDIAKIFGSTCFPFLVDKCSVPGSLQHSHQLRDPTLVQIDLEDLPKPELYTAYKFMFNHSKLFKRYFSVFCNVYSKRNNRSKLLNMVYDCEKQSGYVYLLLNIFYSLLECGFNKINACRQILSRSRDKSSATIDVLVRIIFEADWGMFCDYLVRFVKIYHYSFRINLLNDMASRVLRTKDSHLSSVVWTCLISLDTEDCKQGERSPDLITFLNLIKDGKMCSPDDDRYCCSKLCEESEHTKQMVETNFLNNNREDDPLKIKPLENISPRTEEQFNEDIKFSVDPKFETRLTKFKIPKIAAAINQPPAEVNGSPTKTNIGLSKITRTVQNICAVPPLQPAAVSSPCDLMTDRGQIAGQGGEAINRGAAMIDIAKIFGSTCFPFLVDKCSILGSLQHNHQLRDPTLVQIALEGLPKSELYIAYKFMFNHSKLFKRYFSVFCNVYSKRNNRSKLLNMVYDCEKQSGCVFLLRNIFYSLLECGFNKINACRQILSRSRDKSSATIDVLVGIIFEADWGMFCDYLERFAEIHHYSFRINLLNDMASRVLRTKDSHLSLVIWKCLFTLEQEDFELVQRRPNLIALLKLMKDGKVC